MSAAPRFAVAACLLSAAALAACDRNTTQRAEADARDVGAKIDRALDKTQQKIAEAAHRTEAKINEGSERVAPSLSRAGEKISDAAEKTGEKISAATTRITTGERTSVSVDGVPPDTREKLADSAITAAIKAGYLKDPDLSVLKIDVDTHAGVVTLNGLAKDAAARERAAQIASATRGVREVRNHLTVKKA